jgi:hypothetical protein
MIKRIRYIAAIMSMAFLEVSSVYTQAPSIYRLERLPFNSPDFSEIAPVIVKDGIIFCSDRRTSSIKDRTTFDGKRIYNIYLSEQKDTSDFRKPKEIKSDRNSFVNSGPLCFAADGKTIYFTSNLITGKAARSKNLKNPNGIFTAEISGTSIINIRPFEYNNPQYNVAQPSVSYDGKYLFFASDMPGGAGGSDLYYCENINGKWGNPVNLGKKVNSSSSENYPYIHRSGKLYFSSNRPGGSGGLDVYYTALDMGEWDTPASMPPPINSPSDDFAFVSDDNLQTGYFASNRVRSDDIYKFASTIIRKTSCDTLQENNYCYEFVEENAVKFDSIPFRYNWDFGDGTGAEGVRTEHCYKQPGNYVVRLDVINLVTQEVKNNEKSYDLEVKDIEQPYISGPDKCNTGQFIKFNADSTNLPGWTISRYYWNFGDETIAVGKEVDKSFSKPGIYNIQLIVTSTPDAAGVLREACVCKNITVIR